MSRQKQRKHPSVTKDDDGGLTIHDAQSGVVVSIIGTHPAVIGPKGLTIEVYAYESGKEIGVTKIEGPRTHNPTYAFHAVDREKETPDA